MSDAIRYSTVRCCTPTFVKEHHFVRQIELLLNLAVRTQASSCRTVLLGHPNILVILQPHRQISSRDTYITQLAIGKANANEKDMTSLFKSGQ